MVHAAENLPNETSPNGNGIKVEKAWLQLNPDPLGPQHDEREPGWLWGKIKWPKGLRQIDHNAILHRSGKDRFAAANVQHFHEMKPYRPENLAGHDDLKQYYADTSQNRTD